MELTKDMYEIKAMLPSGRVLESRVVHVDNRTAEVRAMQRNYATLYGNIVVKSFPLTKGHKATVTPIGAAVNTERANHPSSGRASIAERLEQRQADYRYDPRQRKTQRTEIPVHFEVVK